MIARGGIHRELFFVWGCVTRAFRCWYLNTMLKENWKKEKLDGVWKGNTRYKSVGVEKNDLNVIPYTLVFCWFCFWGVYFQFGFCFSWTRISLSIISERHFDVPFKKILKACKSHPYLMRGWTARTCLSFLLRHQSFFPERIYIYRSRWLYWDFGL